MKEKIISIEILDRVASITRREMQMSVANSLAMHCCCCCFANGPTIELDI